MDPTPTPTAREKLIGAAIALVRTQGFAATSVDALCAAAGVTKGAFFHHFPTKEALGVAAARAWDAHAGALFGGAAFHILEDPVARLLAYVALRRDMISGPIPEWTCYAGTTIQETFSTAPAIRDAACASIVHHAEMLAADVAEAFRIRSISPCAPMSLALHMQAVLQGAFIIAKAQNDPEAAKDSLDHLSRYLRLLFGVDKTKEEHP
jgi:TetR/AcrR family transcriptional repressor of nem operon